MFGPRADAVVTALAARGEQAIAGSDLRDEPTVDGVGPPAPHSLDAVIATDWLEHQRWDRWALQRLHAGLVPGGLLVLEVPNLLSPAALIDPRYLARKLAKQAPRVMRWLGQETARSAPLVEVRSYRASGLRALLATLGFEVLRIESRRFASRHRVIARRRPGLYGLDAALAFPPASAHRASFERAHRGLYARRDAWQAVHAAPGAPRSLEPADYGGRRVLVLAPHPDDELIGCGGTMLRMIDAGAHVVVLHATDGSASASFTDEPESVRRTIRLEEARSVTRAIGAEAIVWGEDNRAFAHRPDLVARLAATLDELEPALVFVPFVTDIHPDHVLLARLLADALEGREERVLSVLGYEVWSRVPANAWCDVAAVMARLEAALFLYATEMKVDDYVHYVADRNYMNSLELTGSSGFVEAFHERGPRDFRALMSGAEHAESRPGQGGSP